MSKEILARHKVGVKELDWSRLEEVKECIKFVQVTASRNVDGYPFIPILDYASKNEIESKLKKIIMVECESRLEVNSMTESDRKMFSDQGLTFSRHPSLDNILTDSKADEGCCIYYNADLTQIAWINADDHIRYFVTHRVNPNLQQAYTKLFSRLRAVESSIPMCHDKCLGYLTCNPENIGTALRVRVMVQVRNPVESFDLLSEYCKPYGVAVREISRVKYEISLVRSFQIGKTECDLIAGLVECICELLKNERRTACNAASEEQKVPHFDETNTSLIKLFVTPDVWNKYRPLATSFGFTLADCIRPGMVNHKIGLVAADAECYEVFEDLFVKIAQVYYENYRKVDFQLVPADLREFEGALRTFKPLRYFANGYLMWQGNLVDRPFPMGLNKKTREETNAFLFDLLDPLIKKYNLTSRNIEETQELLCFYEAILEKNKFTELMANWPEQRSLLRDPTGTINILTNVVNHIVVAISLNEKDIAKSTLTYFEIFNDLVLSHFKLWAFSDIFGFYGTLPTDIGNAFSIQISLRIPHAVDMDEYLPLLASKNTRMNLEEGVTCVTHKHKFTNPSQCILDIMETVSVIAKEETLKEIFTSGLLKQYEKMKTSRGITLDDILETMDPDDHSIILTEGFESFVVFSNLYQCALKKSSGEFDLFTFNCNLSEPVLSPLELPAIPTEGIGKIIEVSRDFTKYPFPGFMKTEDRIKLTKSLIPILNELEVSLKESVGSE
eukprot:TRINITY_DN13897_c0_g1_i4.p1 TRINITY_DN13897_c0_g1~~TRINITY_DN13897_c0_g1_i4.p1  ORF type:complete len:729 (-),score=126.81 TRINITY_DN13897_c0_g1_i4:291-2477(-)